VFVLRIGEGFDTHRLVAGRPLCIGCVEVPAERGSFGHSDGDVVAHAVCDALLGALALGDIGRHFPAGEPRWKDADSRVFLAGVAAMLAERGTELVNVDVTVVLERPRLGPYIEAMRTELAAALGCSPERISVKAKTAEGLGDVGMGEAVEARAVALVETP